VKGRAEKMKRTIFVLAMSLFSPATATVNAADINDKYSYALPEGKIGSCGQYVAARDEARRTSDNRIVNVHIYWIFGYETAYNLLAPDTYSISGDTDILAMLLWLENYCKENPLVTFPEAMQLLW
jgi:hypothetical protein